MIKVLIIITLCSGSDCNTDDQVVLVPTQYMGGDEGYWCETFIWHRTRIQARYYKSSTGTPMHVARATCMFLNPWTELKT